MSQAQLAAIAGISRASVSAYERTTATPSPRMLTVLATALNTTVEDLTLIDTDTAALADLRYHSGLTQALVAERLHLSPSTFPAIERGEQPPSQEQARLLADIYKVTPEEVRAAWERTRTILSKQPPR